MVQTSCWLTEIWRAIFLCILEYCMAHFRRIRLIFPTDFLLRFDLCAFCGENKRQNARTGNRPLSIRKADEKACGKVKTVYGSQGQNHVVQGLLREVVECVMLFSGAGKFSIRDAKGCGFYIWSNGTLDAECVLDEGCNEYTRNQSLHFIFLVIPLYLNMKIDLQTVSCHIVLTSSHPTKNALLINVK